MRNNTPEYVYNVSLNVCCVSGVGIFFSFVVFFKKNITDVFGVCIHKIVFKFELLYDDGKWIINLVEFK